MQRTFERIFIHTTDASYQKVNPQFFAVNRWHFDRFGNYFNDETKEQVAPSSLGYYGGYTILIERNGQEFRYREDWEETMAVKGWNRRSLSVALAFDGDIEMPTSEQISSLKTRLLKWCEKYKILSTQVYFVGPHRLEAPDKTCYGSLLPDDWAIKLLAPVKKDDESQKKKDNTEAQKAKLDSIQTLLLRLKIQIGLYIESMNKRNKGR